MAKLLESTTLQLLMTTKQIEQKDEKRCVRLDSNGLNIQSNNMMRNETTNRPYVCQ